MNAGWFRKYTHIAAQRNGLAVAAVKGGTCQGCFIGVRPKLVQDLHYGEEVISCEGCQRILYLDDGAQNG
jgi:predicted  nucleic acid-binding Zn-ribbon protein